MKLNATSELLPISMPEFASLHPFSPEEQSVGFQEMLEELDRDLCQITGYDKFSFQPNRFVSRQTGFFQDSLTVLHLLRRFVAFHNVYIFVSHEPVGHGKSYDQGFVNEGHVRTEGSTNHINC